MVGPTATGKSAVALGLARAAPGAAVVSVDSMQVYRGMDIGTAKPGPEERRAVPHFLIDVADPGEDYSVSRYQADAGACLAERCGRPTVLAGGTGLYLRAVVDRLEIPGRWPEVRAALEEEADRAGPEALHRRLAAVDPRAASRMEPTNRRRIVRALEVCTGSGRAFSSFGPGLEAYPPVDVAMVGLAVDRPTLDARIAERYRAQLAAGFLDEVRALLDRPGGWARTARQALGYKELAAHLEGDVSLDEAVGLAVRRTRAFARRQEAWFRRDPRIDWVPAGGAPEETVAALTARLGDWWG